MDSDDIKNLICIVLCSLLFIGWIVGVILSSKKLKKDLAALPPPKPRSDRPALAPAFMNVVKAYGNLSPDEQKLVTQQISEKIAPFANVLNTIIPSTVITAGSFVVTYRNITFKLTPEQIQAKLTEIVDANPNTDIKKLQGPLGIQIVDVQGSKACASDGDIYS